MIFQETLCIVQKAFVKGKQKLEIRTDGDLEITFKSIFIQRQFRVPLAQIIPKSERHKIKDPGAMVGLCIFGLLTFATLYGMFTCFSSPSDRDVAGILFIPFLFFLVFALVCFFRLRTQSVNATVFYTRGGNEIDVWFEKPDTESFNSFCETLSKKAQEAWDNRQVDPAPQSLAGELTALKKLKDSRVLNDAEFERAKAKLLEHAEQKRIGFA